MVALITALAIVAVTLVGLAAYGAGIAYGTRKSMRELGFTKESARIYVEAMTLLNRLVRLTQLDGVFSEDLLSEDTKKEINELLTRYRKDLNRR